MPIRCGFSTGGLPYLFQLHRADLSVADLRFSLRRDGTLIYPDDTTSSVCIQNPTVTFEPPRQFQDDDLLVTAVEFSGVCMLSADPDLDRLPAGTELDYELDIQLANGQLLQEGNDWNFLERDSLPLT